MEIKVGPRFDVRFAGLFLLVEEDGDLACVWHVEEVGPGLAEFLDFLGGQFDEVLDGLPCRWEVPGQAVFQLWLELLVGFEHQLRGLGLLDPGRQQGFLDLAEDVGRAH